MLKNRFAAGPQAVLTGRNTSAWQYEGEHAAFIIRAHASLEVTTLLLISSSGLAFEIETGAELVTARVQLDDDFPRVEKPDFTFHFFDRMYDLPTPTVQGV